VERSLVEGELGEEGEETSTTASSSTSTGLRSSLRAAARTRIGFLR